MTKIILVALFFSTLVYAEAFKINGEIADFKRHSSGLLIKDCVKSCEALRVLSIEKYDPKSIKTRSTLAASTGSTACHYLLNGVTIMGKNLENDGRDFCIFKDKSMVEINSLGLYLEKNKVKK